MSYVLFIEPDSVLARTYVQALRHVGHEVTHVQSAQEAVEAMDDRKPDVIVLELQLAVHGGIEFLQEFRSYPEWNDIPVIVNTVLSPAALAPVSHGLESDMGVVISLYKPRTSLQQLIRAVNQVLEAV